MKSFFFLFLFYLGFLPILYTTGQTKPGCLEKEKALTLLETAEDLLSKAGDSLPSCKEDINSTDQSECGGEKPLAYIEISKKLISDVRKNFPTCSMLIIKDEKPKDCSEILAGGHNWSGVYTIWPWNPFTNGKSLQVYCDMETDDGGWTVIQRRGKFPIQQDFYRDWESYKNGFGNITEEFWLGNENIRVLCHDGCKIRFDLLDRSGVRAFAVYQNFNLSSSYSLHISDYAGNAGDAMTAHDNYGFSTKDRGLTEKAEAHQGAWWYGGNFRSNLNGVYQPYKTNDTSVIWYDFRNSDNLAGVEIKVRPKVSRFRSTM